MQAMNKELSDTLQISTDHHGPSHMWTAETLGSYFKFLAVEIRNKRRKLGLTAHAKAMVVMDKAPQHSSSTFKKLRERFEIDNNVLLLHGEFFMQSLYQQAWVCRSNMPKSYTYINIYIYTYSNLSIYIYVCVYVYIYICLCV